MVILDNISYTEPECVFVYSAKHDFYQGQLTSVDPFGNVVLSDVGDAKETIVIRSDTIMMLGRVGIHANDIDTKSLFQPQKKAPGISDTSGSAPRPYTTFGSKDGSRRRKRGGLGFGEQNRNRK